MAVMKSEDAVSPVIGVILMVAITVILAAIIASFVFGSASNIQKTKVVAASAQLDSTGSIIVVYQGGQDDPTLEYITIAAPNATVTFVTTSAAGELTPCAASCSDENHWKPDIGAIMRLHPRSPSDWPSDQKHVVVVGVFGDGYSQVITDSFV